MVSEFKPDTQTWGTMVTTGTTPTMRADHCIVPNEDGTKVVVYGGRLENNTVIGDISILDTATQTWTAGAIGPPRMYAACAVAGDQLIIWGGKAADDLPPPNDLIIYNIVTRTWVSQYTPPASYRDLKDPPALTRTTAPWPVSPQKGVVGSTDDTTASKSLPVGAIVGGIVAGLVLVVVCVWFFVFRRRRQTRGPEQEEGNGEDETGGGRFAILRRRVRSPFAVKSKKQESPHEKQEHPVSGEAELTMKELQELENQQQELEKKRLQLVLQQQQVPYPPPPQMTNASSQLRGPTEYLESLSNYQPPPNNPEFIAPLPSSEGGGGDAGKVGERRTVQDTTGLSTNFMDWTVRLPNNPHAVVGHSGIGADVGGGGVSQPLFSQPQQQQRQYSRAMSM
ncbi:Acyl-CoA-binding domain-containing protein 5 [Linnemannia gamsii]|uniref:Acyl-CoA-binding domain-containing protein 5 n=1 Tax=Linnemannia gamsii TaxID=64522 RepID=A0ABQ7K2W3_9FUNG|nr:Acyl-CoA-binding domain-containing protein 5 [Linnemannia gamsii]